MMPNISLDDFIPGSQHFKWQEALFLPRWNFCAHPTQEQHDNIVRSAAKMDVIRDLLKSPLTIHSWLRPDQYNKLIGGAPNSWHTKGLAIDFSSRQLTCNFIRYVLLPKLEILGIRMENLPNSNWVHIDLGTVTENRYFTPNTNVNWNKEI